MRDLGRQATAGDIVIFISGLDVSATPQVFPIAGGQSGSLNIYLKFVTAPSAGTVSVEYIRPGSTVWAFVQGGQGASITTGTLTTKVDGGISALRITFAGLTGGTLPTIGVSADPTATPPSDLLSDGGFGASRRIRVDPGQTGFFAGKFYRSYIEALIPVAGPSVQFQFTSPIDFILWSQVLVLTQGAIDFRVYTGATPSGSWTARPIIGVNRMAQRPQPYYAAQVTLETGGNFSGGTEVDLIKVRASAANNSAQNVGSDVSERGLPAGVYHGRFTTLTGGVVVNDPAQLVYSLLWEERPIIT